METMETDNNVAPKPEISEGELAELDRAIANIKFPEDCRKKMVDDNKELWISTWHGDDITLDDSLDNSSLFMFLTLLLLMKHERVSVICPSVITSHQILQILRRLSDHIGLDINDKLTIGVPSGCDIADVGAMVIYALPPFYENRYKGKCQIVYQPMEKKRPDSLIMCACTHEPSEKKRQRN